MPFEYDVIVIGSGPAGEGAAMQLAKSKKNVAIVEKHAHVGGDCTHGGTIPSKALRQIVSIYTDLRSNPILSQIALPTTINVPQMLETAERVINAQTDLRSGFYNRNHVPVIHGKARFIDKHTLEITSKKTATRKITAAAFVIATGSRPYQPSQIDFSKPRVYDAKSILELDFSPRSITIYGAGVIGCEYASIFKGLGIKINLINTRARLLEFLDEEITDALAYHLRDVGVILRHREEFASIEYLPDKVILKLKSGKKIQSDIILWANGRTGNSHEMGLEEIGIFPNNKGQIPIDKNHCTSISHIYAAGDIIGPPGLASAAYNQGRYAAKCLLGETNEKLTSCVPTGIYTSPEISSLGKTEKELTEQKIPYEVGHSAFKNLARAQITGVTTGMLKILFHRDTKKILGIHCFGQGASEIIHIGQAIMSQDDDKNTIDYFTESVFNYPTMAEAYRVAALNGLNRLA